MTEPASSESTEATDDRDDCAQKDVKSRWDSRCLAPNSKPNSPQAATSEVFLLRIAPTYLDAGRRLRYPLEVDLLLDRQLCILAPLDH